MAAGTTYPGPGGFAQALRRIEADIEDTLAQISGSFSIPKDAIALMKAEQEHMQVGRRVADLLVTRDIVAAHADPKLVAAAHKAQQRRFREDGGTGKLRKVGHRQVAILLPGGTELALRTPYVLPREAPADGQRRKGFYPVLIQLGIEHQATPLTRSTLARQLVRSDSYAEAIEELERVGLRIQTSTLVRIAVAMGMEALARRDEALDAAKENPLPQSNALVAGKRVRVSLDGGRTRVRRTDKSARVGKNLRRPFVLEWREPRIITIDILNAKGEKERTSRPIYEVVLGDADQVFDRLTGLLRLVGAHQAEQLVFVSDGAEWIWRRVEVCLDAAGIDPRRRRLVLDYYHVTEHISEALSACKNLTAEERQRRCGQLRRLLLQDKGSEQVLRELSRLAVGRRATAIQKEIRYLTKHLSHMRYADLKAEKVPIGSGTVESAIRRILNMRFKGASKCWRPDHVEPLVYLRAILKAGWWDEFMTAQLSAKHWLSSTRAMSSEETGFPEELCKTA